MLNTLFLFDLFAGDATHYYQYLTNVTTITPNIIIFTIIDNAWTTTNSIPVWIITSHVFRNVIMCCFKA